MELNPKTPKPQNPKQDPRNIIMESYKVIILGEQSVGKTALFIRQQKDEFDQYGSKPTVSATFATTQVKVADSKTVKLQLWDTCSQERFRTITRTYF